MKLEDYLKQLEKGLQSKQLGIGWFSTAKYPDAGTPVAYVAMIQELGSPEVGIPPRPFMRPVFAEKKNEWQKIAATMIKQSKDSSQILDMLGTTISGQIKEKISTILSPALSPITLALREKRRNGLKINKTEVESTRAELASDNPPKLSSNTKPLNDTGYMIATLTYEIKDVG